MTPAINVAKKLKLNYQLHEYTHDDTVASYGQEAADKLGVAPERVFKTLVVEDEHGSLYVAIIPVCSKLNFKKVAKAVGCKKVQMADPKIVERSTGYVLGGVSPLGQKKRLTTVIDASAQPQTTIYVSGGKRGLEIELAPRDLAKTLSAHFIEIKDEL